MQKRNYGIDLLRILSMFMIVTLHVLGRGGFIKNSPVFGSTYFTVSLLNILTYYAVNCFAIITGYVMLNSRPRVSKLIGLWLQVIFYALTMTAVQYAVSPEMIGSGEVLKAIFPVIRQNYWYISAYVGVYILSPILNSAVKNTDKKTMTAILAAAFVIFTVLPTVLDSDPFEINRGYSLIWLVLMYVIGAYIKQYDVAEKIKRRHAWTVFAAMIGISFASQAVIALVTDKVLGRIAFDSILVSYTSPTMVVAAVALFLALVRQDFPKGINKAIGIFSPAALGVYLIHIRLPIWSYMSNVLSPAIIKHGFIATGLSVILIAAVLCIMCSVIELIRIRMFRVIGVEKLCGKADTALCGLFDRLYSKLK